MTLEFECLMQHNWQSYYWTVFYRWIINRTEVFDFLSEVLPFLLKNLPYQTRLTMWYCHDNCHVTHSKLDEYYRDSSLIGGLDVAVKFHGQFVCRIPFDHRLWRTVKNEVFREPPTIVEDT